MLATVLTAALTVIGFIIGQVAEGAYKWDEDLGESLQYTSGRKHYSSRDWSGINQSFPYLRFHDWRVRTVEHLHLRPDLPLRPEPQALGRRGQPQHRGGGGVRRARTHSRFGAERDEFPD